MTIRKVIDGGLCIGCGACTSVAPRIRVEFNDLGDLVAALPADASADEIVAGSAVCPFTDGEDESAIARRVFGRRGASWDDEIGMHIGTHAAYSPAHQAAGSSGGVVTWMLSSLLERRLIDFAIHVAPANIAGASRFFAYQVTNSAAMVESGTTSFYYPVSMDEVLALVRSQPGRYAVTGVPCFHKALRKLRAHDAVIDERIRYQIGIVCGQMKSAHYMEYLTRMAGGTKGRLTQACFRRKVPGRPANDYAFEAVVEQEDGKSQVFRVMNSEIGANWGMGYFKPLACEVCDDVFAETADVAAMDAWLPQFVKDGQGWSLIVSRTAEIETLVKQAAVESKLVVQPVSVLQITESQRGGLNHRRNALPYRLWMRRRVWTPKKRATPAWEFPWQLRVEQRVREILRSRSRTLWLRTGHTGDLEAFRRGMRWYVVLFRLVARIKQMSSAQKQS